MKKDEAKSFINSFMKPLVVDKGFRLRKGIDGGFYRSIPQGSQYIGVPFIDYGATFEFSLVVGIRLDVVEDIANKFNMAPTKYHSLTQTAIFRLDRFMPGMETQFAIVTEDDIKEAIVCLEPVIRGRIIPFLDKAQDIQTVAEAMNLTDIPKVLPGAANTSAITIAWLIQHPEFETIAATYQQRISQLSEIFQENLKNFIQYLHEKVQPKGIIS